MRAVADVDEHDHHYWARRKSRAATMSSDEAASHPWDERLLQRLTL
jgi:hypothetical protein